jgi:ribosomal-protein-alanine N-acetyltransferase
VLRPMTLDDLPLVVTLQQQSFQSPWSEALLRREFDHEWSRVTVAELPVDGRVSIAGFSIYWLVHDELHLLTLAVATAFRRKGVASALLNEALGEARSRPCTLATLEVRRSNEAALALYERFGFRRVGVRPNYYVAEREDAVVMVREL